MTEPIPPPDDEELDDVEEPDPAPLSFFADAGTDRTKLTPHELADVLDRDDRISTNVYRIYVSKLAGRGLMTSKQAGRAYTRAQLDATNARLRRRAGLAPERVTPTEPTPDPEPKPKEEPTMTKTTEEDDGTPTFAARAAATRLAKTHGRPPTIAEVKNAMTDHPHAEGSLIRQALKRGGIAFTAVRNPAADQKKQPPVKAATRSPSKRPSDDELPPPGMSTGSYLAIMALQTQRAKVAAQLEAIDTTIEALRR